MADKQIKAPGTNNQSISFKMTKMSATQASVGCDPDKSFELFLPRTDDNADFSAKEYILDIAFPDNWDWHVEDESWDFYIPSFIPIRLVGETCGQEVIWSFDWVETTDYTDLNPNCYYNDVGGTCVDMANYIFYGFDKSAIIGFQARTSGFQFNDSSEASYAGNVFTTLPAGRFTIWAKVGDIETDRVVIDITHSRYAFRGD
jgi:hypothetical protein